MNPHSIPASLDVQGWLEHKVRTGESLRVFLNGEDVTERCFRYAFHQDHVTGDVWLFKRNAQGHKYVENGEVAKEVLTGNLSVRPQADPLHEYRRVLEERTDVGSDIPGGGAA